ncbi:MAG: hypothetical protein N3D11_02030 [Candidatus Sumerlaeia bacterium]|nr:hypothetical protein [Candidatus Sumerlaeia bacterium]
MLLLVFLPALSLPVAPQTAPPAPVIVVPPVMLNAPGTFYRNPFICAASNGAVAIVAESGRTAPRRLALAELSAVETGRFSPLDFSNEGDCANPAAAYDASGTLHLVWSEKRAGCFAVRYARRSPQRDWHDAGILSATPDVDCEFPQVACDRSGRVWMAWQAGRATRYSIWLAWRDAVSSGVLDVTGARGDHHNLYPQLFPDTPYPVVWYEEVGNSFQLRAAVVSPAQARFDVVTPLEFERLDANQMPWLFQAPSGMLGGVWTDLIANRVRVLAGLQGPATRGEGVVADTTDAGDAASPSAVSVGEETVALAWTLRQAGGASVWVGALCGPSQVGLSQALPLPTDSAFSRPRLAATAGRLVHCVWYSDSARGGTGSVHYAAVRY